MCTPLMTGYAEILPSYRSPQERGLHQPEHLSIRLSFALPDGTNLIVSRAVPQSAQARTMLEMLDADSRRARCTTRKVFATHAFVEGMISGLDTEQSDGSFVMDITSITTVTRGSVRLFEELDAAYREEALPAYLQAA